MIKKRLLATVSAILLFTLSGCSQNSGSLEGNMEIGTVSITFDKSYWKLAQDVSLNTGFPSFVNNEGCYLINKISNDYSEIETGTKIKSDKTITEDMLNGMKLSYGFFDFKSKEESKSIEMVKLYTENFPFPYLGKNNGLEITRVFSKFENRTIYGKSVSVEIRCPSKININDIADTFNFTY